MTPRRRAHLALLVLWSVSAAGAGAQTTQPAGRFDGMPIRRDAATARSETPDREQLAAPAPGMGLDLGRLALSLAIEQIGRAHV